jgi:hypothetical protein
MHRALRNLTTGFSTIAELLRGIWQGPFWWTAPLALLLLPAALLLVFIQMVPVVTPFVYSLF